MSEEGTGLRETDEILPISHYGKAKVKLERRCKLAQAQRNQCDVRIARIFNVVGAGQKGSLFPQVAFEDWLSKRDDAYALKTFYQHYLGEGHYRDWLDVRDVAAQICELALADQVSHGVYNIAQVKRSL